MAAQTSTWMTSFNMAGLMMKRRVETLMINNKRTPAVISNQIKEASRMKRNLMMLLKKIFE